VKALGPGQRRALAMLGRVTHCRIANDPQVPGFVNARALRMLVSSGLAMRAFGDYFTITDPGRLMCQTLGLLSRSATL
jgi:hypothetical protein